MSEVSEYQVLVDSDAFVGRFYPDDPHHNQAKKLFQSLKKTRQKLVTTSLVVLETATVLSHRTGQAAARAFLENFVRAGKIDVIHIDENLVEQAIDVFLEQEARGTSMTDCANVAVIQRYKIPQIFSFDKVYPKKFDLQAVA